MRIALVLALSFAACAPAPDPQAGPPTWHRDIQPLFATHCVQCHHAQGIGPFELDTLQLARAEESGVRPAVKDRRMPPWPASSSCAEYSPNGALSDDEIGMLEAWYDAAAPEGDPA